MSKDRKYQVMFAKHNPDGSLIREKMIELLTKDQYDNFVFGVQATMQFYGIIVNEIDHEHEITIISHSFVIC